MPAILLEQHLVAHLLDAEHRTRSIPGDQPVPERRTEVEAIVEVLRRDEHAGVE